MRIGYNTWSMAKVPYQAFIPGLSDIGFRAIAISVVPGYMIGGQWVENAAALDRLSADDRRRIKQTFAERDLKLPSVIGNQSLVEEDAAKNAVAMQRLRDSIDLCVEWAIDGHVPTLNTGVAGHSGDLEAKSGLVLDRLGALADHARQRGVVICIEPHVGGAVDTVERSEWLIRAVDSPNIRLDFDVSHEGNGVGRATAPDGRPVEYQFLLAGEGTFDLAAYLKLVCAHGFAEPIAFEASVQCQARPGYDALTSAAGIYRWMADGWRRGGLSID